MQGCSGTFRATREATILDDPAHSWLRALGDYYGKTRSKTPGWKILLRRRVQNQILRDEADNIMRHKSVGSTNSMANALAMIETIRTKR